MFRLIAVVLFVVAFAAGAGCGVAPPRPVAVAPLPSLRLPPAALPGGLALQQRLTFVRDGRRETVDALVEADAASVRVVVHAQGQVALRMAWDGETLEEARARWLPPQLVGDRVLSDLQLVFWPRDAIAAALPGGWTVADAAGLRTLSLAGEPVVVIERPVAGLAVLTNRRDGYELRIESKPVTP